MSSHIFKTSLPVYRYEFKWIFETFSGLAAYEIHTPYFSPIPDQEWNVEFKKCDKLYAFLCSKETVAVNIAYESTLCDNTGHVCYSEQRHVYYSEQNHGYYSEQKNVYYSEQRQVDDIAKINLLFNFSGLKDLKNLPNDVLILKCSLKLIKIGTPEVERIELNFEDSTNAADQLLLNFESMFEKSEHCDVTLKVGGVSIEAHKAILCASSPIFAKMFNHNVKETASNIIDITDISGPIMKQFIGLLYCPIMKENLDYNTACDLYYASDKYEVLSLRSMIGKELINLLNNKNALEILSIADQHNDDRLKEKILQCVRINLKSIVMSDSWEQFVINNAKLASALVINYFKEET